MTGREGKDPVCPLKSPPPVKRVAATLNLGAFLLLNLKWAGSHFRAFPPGFAISSINGRLMLFNNGT